MCENVMCDKMQWCGISTLKEIQWLRKNIYINYDSALIDRPALLGNMFLNKHKMQFFIRQTSYDGLGNCDFTLQELGWPQQNGKKRE